MKWPPRDRLLSYLLWAACGCSVAGAVAALALPLGSGHNRIAGVAIPFAIAAAATAALALLPNLERWLSLVLYGLTALALTYALMSLASLPLRLTVLGTCPDPPAVCPPGFEPGITAGETFGVEAGIFLGLVALLVAVAAMEVRYRPRLRIIGRSPQQQPVDAPSPPPEMRASAIVKKPVAASVNSERQSGGNPGPDN